MAGDSDVTMSPARQVGPESIVDAAKLVRKGDVFDLDTGRFPGMPESPVHVPFTVTTYRTPRGLANQGDSGARHSARRAAGRRARLAPPGRPARPAPAQHPSAAAATTAPTAFQTSDVPRRQRKSETSWSHQRHLPTIALTRARTLTSVSAPDGASGWLDHAHKRANERRHPVPELRDVRDTEEHLTVGEIDDPLEPDPAAVRLVCGVFT